MRRPLRFLHLTTFYPPYSFGGDAMYLYRLCHALADAGHSVDVVHCVDAYHLLHPDPPPVAFAEHPGVRRHALRSGAGWLSPFLTQQTGRPFLKRRALRRVLQEREYDVVHYHNTSLLGPTVLALSPANRTAVKIYTTHEHWLVCPMHVLWKFNERACEKPECLKCTLMGKRPPQLWRYTGLLSRMSRHVDRFVSPSRFTARMHGERGFPQPVGHLPYFVERTDGDWRDPGPPPHPRPYFLFVGRLEKIKGLQQILPLWSRMPQADLLVAGAGTYQEELRQLAAGNERVRFLGALPQRELGPLYHHARAALIPSITYETFGMPLIEAFARKTPVIARDLGPMPEVIEDSGGGFVFRTDDEFLDHARLLAAQPARRDELGERGYQAFLRFWTKEAHLAMYDRLIDEIAEHKFGRIPWRQIETREALATA